MSFKLDAGNADEDKDDMVPLIVDLDGTLCRTDTLHESLLFLVSKQPMMLFYVPFWLSKGRSELKAHVFEQAGYPVDDLPLNAEVVSLIKDARTEGRTVALVSAADHRLVTAVAERTQLFDEAYGSAQGLNLKGSQKADFLTEKYGKGAFDYVGDSSADLAVWAVARRAITVGANNRLRQAAQKANADVLHISPKSRSTASMIKALRPHQWSKNTLLFLPLLAAHDLSSLPFTLLGFIAFSLTASAVYVLNDLADLSADRRHPRKRFRPFAAGDLSASMGITMAALLILLALLTATLTGSFRFMLVLVSYFFATFAYSLFLKRRLIVDVLTLAGLYTIRIIAGGAAASIDLSPWMLAFSMFLFLALATVKRQAELTDQLLTGRESVGRAYRVEDLPILRITAISSGQAAVLVLALYISSDDVQTLYLYPALLWLVCPLLLYWVLRMVMKTHRGEMPDDPILFAATDRISIVTILVCFVVGFLAATWPWVVPRI